MTYPQLSRALQPIDLPPLPDAAAVVLIDVLYELLSQLKGHYFHQLRRDHSDYGFEHLRQPDLFEGAPDFDDPLSF